MVIAQGGDPAFIDDPSRLPQPGAIREIRAEKAGFVNYVDAREIGKIVLRLGGGRQTVTDQIDHAAGVDRLVQQGEWVEKGEPLMRLLAKDDAMIDSFVAAAHQAITLGPEKVADRLLILPPFLKKEKGKENLV